VAVTIRLLLAVLVLVIAELARLVNAEVVLVS
jgi:hypothetical protein